MSDPRKTDQAEAAAQEQQAPREEPLPAEEASQEHEPDPLDALKSENAELRDRLLRTVADMDNLRKRSEREVRDAGQYAIAGFARDMLGVGDNMRRALDSVGEEARAAADDSLRALLDGVEMTERELLNALERHGIRRIEAAGARFDPNRHQAMFEVMDESVPAGTVVQVMQEGYAIGERVLRPAMVGVAKGGGRAAAPDGNGEVGASINRTA